ncbi:MAG: hypothetical protein DRH57_04010 [Candidatus Cloacimonadota bacterium]|nr:MAG: hypothetical protein DRH57_04010 [Candidatus Cloacimonadota bacterium]
MKDKYEVNFQKISIIVVYLLFSIFYVTNTNCQISNIIPSYRIPPEGTIVWETAGCNLLLHPIEYTEFIDVTEQGVVGDGFTHNYNAINQILSNIDPNEFTIVYFPSGTYIIEQGLTLPNNTVIKGAGSDNTYLKFDLLTPDNCMYVSSNKVGIEDLYIERVDTEGDNGDNIRFSNADSCWVRGIESYYPQRYHITIQGMSSYISITGCYFHHAQDYGGGGHGYGICIVNLANHCLIENNIFKKLRHSIILGQGPHRNVFGYNYSRDAYGIYMFMGIPIQIPVADICLHGDCSQGHSGHPYTGPTYNLFEGNIVEWIFVDAVWDYNGPYNTFFRNRAYHYGFKIETSHSGYPITNDDQYRQNIVACDADPDPTTQNLINDYGFSAYWPENYLSIPDTQASYYYSAKPNFITNWPFLANQDNPAKNRWDSGGTKTVFAGFSEYKPPTVENVRINIDTAYVYVEWDSVPGATSYKIYSSNNPYTEFELNTSGTFNGTTWQCQINENRKFYYVNAIIDNTIIKN